MVSFFHVMLCPRQEMPQRLEEKTGILQGYFANLSGIFRLSQTWRLLRVPRVWVPPCLGRVLGCGQSCNLRAWCRIDAQV